MKELTTKQLNFCNLVLLGDSLTEAYQKAGYQAEGSVANACASKLASKPHVAAYIARGRKALEDKASITREELVETLSDVLRANGKDIPPGTAANLLAKMLGWNAPEKQEVTQHEKLTIKLRWGDEDGPPEAEPWLVETVEL